MKELGRKVEKDRRKENDYRRAMKGGKQRMVEGRSWVERCEKEGKKRKMI